jgi:hypothetical protein
MVKVDNKLLFRAYFTMAILYLTYTNFYVNNRLIRCKKGFWFLKIKVSYTYSVKEKKKILTQILISLLTEENFNVCKNVIEQFHKILSN